MDVKLTRYDVTGEVSLDDSVEEIVQRYNTNLKKSLQKRIGTIQVQILHFFFSFFSVLA